MYYTLSDQLKRKTDDLADLEEKLEGAKQEFDLEVASLNVRTNKFLMR